MQKIVDDVLELIASTPMVRLNKIAAPGMAEVCGKLESCNPAGSLKDRICLSMIEDAEKKGLLKQDFTIVEPTSGNTGIGLAMVAAVKGYDLILTMPDSMSVERRHLLKAYGAKIVLIPGREGMRGAVKKAEEIVAANPNCYMPQQFNNQANPEAHGRTTAREILDATDGRLDVFVAGVGTGGTITGVGQILKKKVAGVKVVALEPVGSAVMSGNACGPHSIQGIGARFIPEVMDMTLVDEVVAVKDDAAFKMTKRLAQEEGLLLGISSGATVWAALKQAKSLDSAKRVIVILCDTGERYFSLQKKFEKQYFAELVW